MSSMIKSKKFCSIFLRLLAFGATIAAIVVMVTSHDFAHVLNLTFTAKFSNEPVFKYFVIAEALACGYSLIVLFITCFQNSLWRLVLILDVVITMILSSSVSAAMAIAHVGKKGNSDAGWLPICGQVPKFCDHVNGSLISAFFAAFFYFLLVFSSLYSTHNPLIL